MTNELIRIITQLTNSTAIVQMQGQSSNLVDTDYEGGHSFTHFYVVPALYTTLNLNRYKQRQSRAAAATTFKSCKKKTKCNI